MDYKLLIKKIHSRLKVCFVGVGVLSTRLDDLVFLDPKITNKTHLVRVEKYFYQTETCSLYALQLKY